MTALNTVAEMRTLAKSLGIKGYSGLKKNDLAAAIDAYYADARKAAESAPKRMSNGKRTEVYLRQSHGKISFRQARRIRKNENRLKG